MYRELDLRIELRNIQRMRGLAKDSAIQYVPRSFPSLSRHNVLALERVDGLRMTGVMLSTGSGGTLELRETGNTIHPIQLAQNLMRATLTQMFEYQFFHADVHPGNLFALKENVIGYIDFGLCDSIEPDVVDQQTRFVAAIYDGDEMRVFKAIRAILIPSDGSSIEKFRSDFSHEMQKWRETSANLNEDESPISQWLIGMMRAARRNGFTLPPGLLSAYRTLLTAETVAYQLSGKSQLRSVGQEFFVGLQFREMLKGISPTAVKSTLPTIIRLLRHGPGQLEELLGDLSEGHFEMRVHMSEDISSRAAKSKRVRLLVLALISLGLSVLLAAAIISISAPSSLRWALSFLTGCTYLVLIVKWRRLD
jgi:ubiquinone biosynthesis protein